MTNIDEVVERCAGVVAKWSERIPTIEMAQDFAGVFGFQLNWTLTPAAPAPAPEPEPTGVEPQYELFNEMSAEDTYAMKTWRSNNGL
jgi:hypothetical protein